MEGGSVTEGKGEVSPDVGSLKPFSDGLRLRSGSRDDVTLRNTNNWRGKEPNKQWALIGVPTRNKTRRKRAPSRPERRRNVSKRVSPTAQPTKHPRIP